MPTDRLNRKTGLYSQEIIEALLFHEIARVERYPIPLAILRIATEYTNKPTHDVIEGAKLAVAHILKANLRVADVAGHYENDYLQSHGDKYSRASLRLREFLKCFRRLKSRQQMRQASLHGLKPSRRRPILCFLQARFQPPKT